MLSTTLALLAACDRPAPSAAPAPSASAPTNAGAPHARLARAESRAAARVDEARIRARVRFLADDALEGRAPGTRGGDLATKYIAAEMEAMGLEPGGDDGTFFQKVPLVGITAMLPKELVLRGAGDATLSLRVGEDVTIRPGMQSANLSFDAPDVVFVGYGIVSPEWQWDDYKDVDVRGKAVLIMNDDPSDDPALFAGKTRTWYGRWDYKYLEAARHGAAAAILVHTPDSAGYPWQVVTSSWSPNEKFELPATPDEPRSVATMWATEDASRRIASLGGKDLDALRAAAKSRAFRPTPLGVRVAASFRATLREIASANVIGVLRGRDAALAREAVVYSAHHDHLGIGPAKDGDSIYNGAVDNASGVAGILAIADAASASPRTRRSLVFMAVTAEEQGLLGSEWYCRHPTFAPGRIAADLNIDSMNVLGKTTDVDDVTWGRSSLDAVVTSVAAAQGRTVHAFSRPELGAFYRSDQLSFARIGVPSVYVRGGPSFVGRPPGWGREQSDAFSNAHYHQPSDEMNASWDLSGAVQDAQLLLVAGMRVANADAMPSWNAGDEFEATRRRALEKVE